MKTVGFYTLGCKVNTYESEYMMSLFKEKGYEIKDFKEDCDVYVINTCTVTNNSDKKDKKIINQVKNKDACIVVCGCFVESNKNYKFDGVDIIIGNYNKSKIAELVEQFFKTKKQITEKENIMQVPFEDMKINHLEDRTRAFVKIQDGCQNYCSYCIIPFVRGRCRSKKRELVLEEINELVNNNYKEIVLTGIHTGNYGSDINLKFSTLLKDILEIEKLKRLRISSVEITELDEEFLHLLENKKLCNQIHIPLQSGSDKILKLMNRKYDKKQFLESIKKIRKIRPDIAITTDVIVGFPDEDEKDFKECINFIKKIKFAKVHVFPYSKRDGTKAARMKNQIPEEIKKKRAKQLIELSEKLEYKYFKKFINKNEEILVEKYEDGYSYGHTSNYLYLKIDKKLTPNEIYNIKIKRKYYTK